MLRRDGCDIKISVVIPCYKVTQHVLGVISSIDSIVDRIFVVDDCCPDGSGRYVRDNVVDPRVVVLCNGINLGVGGAVMAGYGAAIKDGMDIIVKIDGDGQMDPAMIEFFVAPIIAGDADYTKGNRFYDLEKVRAMPGVRLFGNAVLSLMTKLSSGYWNVFDPTNGYTAIHAKVARLLPFEKISGRYFFETDMLFRLNTFRAVVVDVPMAARYADEISGLKIRQIVGEFMFKHCRNFLKRLFYNYYLRDLSIASIELPVGLAAVSFGVLFGGWQWYMASQSGVGTPAGTVMLAALPVLTGVQLLLAFLAYDISAVPRYPCQKII